MTGRSIKRSAVPVADFQETQIARRPEDPFDPFHTSSVDVVEEDLHELSPELQAEFGIDPAAPTKEHSDGWA